MVLVSNDEKKKEWNKVKVQILVTRYYIVRYECERAREGT